MEFKINYVEGNDAPPVYRRPTVPDPDARPAVPPPPGQGGSGTGAHWFVCGNDACSHVGHVATGNNDPVHRERFGRCRECGGIGVDQDGGSCENCGGRGRRVIKEWDDDPVNPCPWCHVSMVYLQQGGFPVGYPRMETPHSETDGPMRGDVGFGRTRIVE